jgi:transcriptional regulator
LAVSGDYTYIPSYWRAAPDAHPDKGVPTSYYASVQFVCTPRIVDDPQGKANILTAQLADYQPEGHHGPVAEAAPPYGRLLSGIRAVQLAITQVDAKFKFDDQKPVEHRLRVAEALESRSLGLDARAAKQQRRRLEQVEAWRGHR